MKRIALSLLFAMLSLITLGGCEWEAPKDKMHRLARECAAAGGYPVIDTISDEFVACAGAPQR